MDRGSWHYTRGSDQDHPEGKEIEKCKMAVWGGLTNAWEKKSSKGNGENERYTHMKAEFQRKQGKIRKPSFVINAKK